MTETGKKKFAENLNKQLTKSKIQINELARRTGITREMISKYINAHHAPNAERLGTIATCLGCTVKDLLKGIKTEEML